MTSKWVRPSIDLHQKHVIPVVEGLVATDGLVYSPVATFGTTPVDILDVLLDPGYSMALKKIQVGLTQSFDNLIASSVGSLIYYWRMRSEYINPQGTKVTGAYVNIMGTYAKGIPTSGVSGDPAEDTVSGYVAVASLPGAPVRAVLTAVGLVASSMAGKVKNSSYFEIEGIVIPGT